MEEVQTPQQPHRRSKHAVFSALFAALSIVLIIVPSDQIPTIAAAILFYVALVLAMAALVTGWLALIHLKHDPSLGGSAYAWFGVGLALAEILFGLWAVGNAFSQ
ncbi:MAG: hypothetical protein Q7T25_07930 [Sideroxyarcus sp.]|nr:hypothetical protein [Sideroxyarcus sp.]